MPNFSSVALSATGRPIAGATISIYTTSGDGVSTGSLAAIFSDQNLLNVQANPFAADGLGNFSFWVQPATYVVTISGVGITTQSFTITVPSAIPSYSLAGAFQNNVHVVQDTVTLAAGTAAVTLLGAAIFASASSYACVAQDDTAANPVRVTQTSGSSITFTGTGTDVIRFIAIGN